MSVRDSKLGEWGGETEWGWGAVEMEWGAGGGGRGAVVGSGSGRAGARGGAHDVSCQGCRKSCWGVMRARGERARGWVRGGVLTREWEGRGAGWARGERGGRRCARRDGWGGGGRV